MARPPWTSHPSTGRACGWPLRGWWLDHRSPTTAYGLTHSACRAAVYVGVGAMQDRKQAAASAGGSRVLTRLSTGPAPPTSGHVPAPSGQSPEESGAARRPVHHHDLRTCLPKVARKLATRTMRTRTDCCKAPPVGRWMPNDRILSRLAVRCRAAGRHFAVADAPSPRVDCIAHPPVLLE